MVMASEVWHKAQQEIARIIYGNRLTISDDRMDATTDGFRVICHERDPIMVLFVRFRTDIGLVCPEYFLVDFGL